MNLKEQAKQDYLAGMKYKDIADKYDVSVNTIKSWKRRYEWVRDKSAPPQKRLHPKSKKVAPKNETKQVIDQLADSELTDKQKAFVLEFVRLSNATQAYINAYDSTYNIARANGSRMLTNANIQQAIATLRKAKLHDLSVNTFDLIQDLAKEARADIGDFLAFGNYDAIETDIDGNVQLDVNDEPIVNHRSWVQFKNQDKVDTSLIKNISMGKDGPRIELYDRDKARKQLLDYLVQIELVANDNQQVILSDSTKERMKDNGED
ncbi:terminase small subunit [Weissella bombi]|uniref:Phage terminase small subunit n=1 Tax=Weissella bombi TaxID=1505725 RepID=A0A1C4C360_9LACO|nr:terminase small subunit [Weissella bombi]SCC13520.1 phage terminase small subunit [Weissella bombi]